MRIRSPQGTNTAINPEVPAEPVRPDVVLVDQLDAPKVGRAEPKPIASPSDIRGLVDYRRQRREASAQGIRMPKLDLGTLPGDPPAPQALQKLMRGVDQLLPKIAQEKDLTLNKLFALDSPQTRGVAGPWQKTLAGAGALATGVVAYQLAGQISGVGDLALAAGAFLVGQKFAGVMSYIIHDLIDDYDFFPEAFEFQVHHEDPGELGRWDAVNTIANIGQYAVPAMGLLAALEPSLGVGAAALAFIGSNWLAPLFHKWTHLPSLPKDATKLQKTQRKLIELAQDIGLIVNKQTHLEHHAGRRDNRLEGEVRLPHTESFDVSSGDLGFSVNALMNRWETSQKMKRTIFLVTQSLTGTGVEPHSWSEHPELKLLWGSEGTAAERRENYRNFRIERQEGQIEAMEKQLGQAQLNLQAPDFVGSPRLQAEGITKTYPARIARMKEQLALFREPDGAEKIQQQYETARQVLLEAKQGEVTPSALARLEKKVQALAQRVLDLAPLRRDTLS